MVRVLSDEIFKKRIFKRRKDAAGSVLSCAETRLDKLYFNDSLFRWLTLKKWGNYGRILMHLRERCLA